MKSKVFAVYSESQIHAGKGTDVGIIDLPIQREKTTEFPIIQGIKGAIRASKIVKNEEKVFGSLDNGDTPGNLAFSEAKILAFPVRHIERLFIWVTCPTVLVVETCQICLF